MTKSQCWILVLWISFTVLAFAYFIDNKLVDFDAEHKLENMTAQEFAPHLSPFLGTNDNVSRIIHFSKKNCDCQQTSELHIKEINNLASESHFDIINIELKEHDIIPSVPSIAIMSKTGEVIYYGPYGQGIACSQTAGYAQTMLKNYLKGYVSNVIIKDAKGCYCSL